MRDSGHVVVCTCVKRRLNAQEDALALSGTQRYLGCSCKTKALPRRCQQRDNRLALARLAHYLASNLQVPLWCHQGSVMKGQSSERHRRATVDEGGLPC